VRESVLIIDDLVELGRRGAVAANQSFALFSVKYGYGHRLSIKHPHTPVEVEPLV